MGMDSGLIGGGLSLVGGLLGGQSAADAARAQGQAQVEAAKIAAEASKFRPVGITTRYGSSNFQFDPTTGYLTGAGYTASPEIQAYQDRLAKLASQQLGTAEAAPSMYSPLTGTAATLFGLSQDYLKQSPEQVAADYIAKQQALLAPSRERETAMLANQLSNTGRTGLSVAQGGGLMSANPEYSALANARAMQDLQLAANADQEARNRITFGQNVAGGASGLLGSYFGGMASSLSPFTTNVGAGATLEDLAANPLTLGSQLGARTAASGAQAGNFLMQGAANAAPYAYKAASYNPLANAFLGAGTNPSLSSGISNLFGNYGGTPQGAYAQQGQYLAGAYANPQTQQAQMLADQNAWFR
jgi:hypothetical protein